MKVVSLKLPPLPGKNISIPPQNHVPSAPKTSHTRKYSVQHLETTDESSENSNPGQKTQEVTENFRKNITESSKSIRIREGSLPSKKIKKIKSMEDQYFSDLPPHVTAKSWVLYEMHQGKILYGKRGKKPRQMASLTKIINLITILQLLEKFELKAKDIRVRASKVSSSIEGTTAQLKHGAEYCLEDLFYGMMLPSGNDAAFLTAEVGGYIIQKKGLSVGVSELSEAIERKNGNFLNPYLREMNHMAAKLCLNSSTFANPHGLNNIQNISCAEDLARLCTYAMKNHKFRKIVKTRVYNYSCLHFEKKVIEGSEEDEEETVEIITKKVNGVWENTNKMLGEGWSGIKTGITPNAGPCLAASLYKTFSGKEYEFLVILLDSESMEARWQQVQRLVDWAIVTRQYL